MGIAPGNIDVPVLCLDAVHLRLRQVRGPDAVDRLVAQGKGGSSMGKFQPHGGAHHGGTVGKRSAAERQRPLKLSPVQQVQCAAGFRGEARHRRKEHRRMLQCLHMLCQADQLPVVQNRNRHDAVEVSRPLQHRVQRFSRSLVSRITGNQQPSRCRRGREILQCRFVRLGIRGKAQLRQPCRRGRAGGIGHQPPVLRKGGVRHQQQAGIKGGRRRRSPYGIHNHTGNGRYR